MILIKPPKMPELGNNDPVYSGINGATVFDHRYNPLYHFVVFDEYVDVHKKEEVYKALEKAGLCAEFSLPIDIVGFFGVAIFNLERILQ